MKYVALDTYNWAQFRPSRYLNANLVDPDMDIDGSAEFGDHDNPLLGLTIVEPESVLETASFLNGYGY